MDNEYLPRFKINKIKYQEDKIKFFSDDDLIKLLERPKDNCLFGQYRTYVMICFVLATGVRIGTLRCIKVEDIDLEAKSVNLRHLKTKQYKILPLVDSLTNELKKYVRMWNNTSEWLFPNDEGGQLSDSGCQSAITRYCRQRGVDIKGWHALRHSFARTYIRNGGNAFTLQQMLCHTDLTMTRRYVRLFSEDIREDVTKNNPLDTIRPLKKSIKRSVA